MDEQSVNGPEGVVISFYTFSAYEKDLEKFNASYAPDYLAVCPDESIAKTLRPASERVCRFCGLSKPDTSFKTKSHSIPEMLGNKYLISDFECDRCNSLFSGLENELANFVGASRAIYGVKGKKMPVYKSVGEEMVVRKEEFYGVKDGTKIAGNKNNETTFRFNKETGVLDIIYLKHAYTPIKVYKALLKIALSILPAEYISDYLRLINLLLSDTENRLTHFANVTITRLSAHLMEPILTPRCHLSKRIDSKAKLCMHMFSFYFLDYFIQFYLPLHEQDISNNLYGEQSITMPLCPPLFLNKPREDLINSLTFTHKSLAGLEPVKEEEVFSIEHAVDALRHTQVYNPATGKMQPSDGTLPDIAAIYMSSSGELPDFPMIPFDNPMNES